MKLIKTISNIIQPLKTTSYIAIILILNTYQNLNTKIGTGYTFNNKKLVKKFYSNNFTHPPQNIKEHSYKSSNFLFKNNKTFKVKSSHTNSKTSIYTQYKYIHGYLMPPTQKNTINIKSSFHESFNMYTDIYPKNNIKLPPWTKSIDFWIKNIPHKNINISFFLKYPNGKETIHKLEIPTVNHNNKWQKLFLNTSTKNTSTKNKTSQKTNILLSKIRITKKNNSSNPLLFYISMSIPKAYNYIKNKYNLYKKPHTNIENFNTNSNHIKYSLNNTQFINSPKIMKYKIPPPSKPNNKTFLAINVKNHNNKSLFIHFPQKKQYKLLFEHNITLWINGKGQKEQISLLFQEGKKRYFELALKEIYFNGWKKLHSSIPRKKITYFKNKYGQKFIYLIGIKITPVYKHKPININIDNIESSIVPKFLGNIKKL